MILIDTSIWIEHLNNRLPRLISAIDDADVLTHPFVIGELACGNIKSRRRVLDLLAELPAAALANHAEALALIERRALMGKGLAYPDRAFAGFGCNCRWCEALDKRQAATRSC